MAILALRTLGIPAIEGVGAAAVTATTTRHRLALLVMIAEAGERGVSRDKLLGYLWADSSADKARHALTQALSQLRRDVGNERLILGTAELRLNSEVMSCDIGELRQALADGDLERAATLYARPFLEDFPFDVLEFDRWASEVRGELARAVSRALSALAHAAERTGDHQRAAEWWRRLVDVDPLAAKSTMGLMRALAAAGDRAAALQHYRTYVALMLAQLECPPDPGVASLAEVLRAELIAQPSTVYVPMDIAESTRLVPAAPTVGEASSLPTPRSRDSWYGRIGARIATAAAVVSLATLIAAHYHNGATARTEDAIPRAPMIAVLPFEGRGSVDKDFVAGMTDQISERLAANSSLSVLARASVEPYVQQSLGPRAVADSLHADYVLTGTIRIETSPNGLATIHVMPKLLAADGRELWSNGFAARFSPGEIIAAQSRIADSVAHTLKIKLSPPAQRAVLEASHTNIVAYQRYVEGLAPMSLGLAPSQQRLAIERFQSAVHADSAFALAWARLAQAQSFYYYQFGHDTITLKAAQVAANRALALDPALPDAQIASGYLNFYGALDFVGALEQLTAVRATQPNNAQLLWVIGSIERRLGRWDQGLHDMRSAFRLDPGSSRYALELGATYLMLRRYAEADTFVERATALAREWVVPYVYRSMLRLMRDGDLAGARRAMQDALPAVDMNSQLGYMVPNIRWFLSLLGEPFAAAVDRLPVATAQYDSAWYYLAMGEIRWVGGRRDARPYFEAARVALERSGAAQSELPAPHGALGIAYAGVGRAADAIREASRAVEIAPPSQDPLFGPMHIMRLIEVYVMVGEDKLALERIRHVLSIPSLLSVPMLRADPHFAPLRGNPGFVALTATR